MVKQFLQGPLAAMKIDYQNWLELFLNAVLH
jgi:hypothetical protein